MGFIYLNTQSDTHWPLSFICDKGTPAALMAVVPPLCKEWVEKFPWIFEIEISLLKDLLKVEYVI